MEIRVTISFISLPSISSPATFLLLFLLLFILLVFSTAPRWTAPAWTPLTLHGPFKSFNGSKIYLCFKKYWEFTTSPTGGIYGYLVPRFVAGSVSSAAQITDSLLTTTDEPCAHRLHLQTFGPGVRSKNREAAVYVDWC